MSKPSRKAPMWTMCLYERKWVPLGRARTRCPKCGAVLCSGNVHPVIRRFTDPNEDEK